MKKNLKPDHNLFKQLAETYSLIRLEGKKPIEDNWERYCHSKRNYAEIGFYPHENAGIACGPVSGVMVVDVDNVPLSKSFLRRYGLEMPDSLLHQTGRGKFHSVFKYPADGKHYGNKRFEILGFDIRGIGGQVVAPGSIHPDTGEPYLIHRDLEPAEPPEWLLDLYTSKRSEWKAIQKEQKTGLLKIGVPKDLLEQIHAGKLEAEDLEELSQVAPALVQADLSNDQIHWVFYTFVFGGDFKELGGMERDKWLQAQIDEARVSQKAANQLTLMSHEMRSNSAPIDKVLSRLSSVTPSSNGWLALCPSHDDHQPSLSVAEADDGKILIKCHAGCRNEDIVRALGLQMKDLFPASQNANEKGGLDPPKTHAIVQSEQKDSIISDGKGLHTGLQSDASVQAPPLGITLKQYAEAKGLPEDFLRSIYLSKFKDKVTKTRAIHIPYFDENGNEVAVRFRTALHKGDREDNRFRWKSGSKPLLYGLWRLREFSSTLIFLVEGESDCHTLWHHGFPALGLPGASTWKEERDAHHLERFSEVYVIVEPDQGGEAVKKWLKNSAIRDRVRLVDLGSIKDPSSLYLSDMEHFRYNFIKALESSIPWLQLEEAEALKQRRETWEKCKLLATEPQILDRFHVSIRQSGVVGEERIIKLLYLAVTSRFLERPISVVVKGPSSAGKSYIVGRVLTYFPEEAYYSLSSMSERAIIYSEEPLRNRFLIIYEAVGMNSELLTYMIRSLLSEGRVRYETVEKTSEGFRPRLMEREGPTGLILTTTDDTLHPENETRMISLTVTDTQEQTKRVMLTLAEGEMEAGDLEEWHALQSWLQADEHRVMIPYARALAETVPPVAVRLRRDFEAILNLIRAHAILHQANRQRDEGGRIIANLEDYEIVREL